MEEQGLEKGKVNFNSDEGRKAFADILEVIKGAGFPQHTQNMWMIVADEVVEAGAIDEEQLGTFIFECMDKYVQSNPDRLQNPQETFNQDIKIIAANLGRDTFSLFDGNVVEQACNYIASKLIQKLRE
jgi:polyhydroxyalkanoate synthesis regulator phasin